MSSPAWSPPNVRSVATGVGPALTQRLWVTCYGDLGLNHAVFGFTAEQQQASGLLTEAAAITLTPTAQGTAPNSYQSLAFAPNGDMWLGSWGANLTQLPQCVFKLTPAQYVAGGSQVPSVVLTMPALDSDDADVGALAFDAAGNLWASFGSAATGRLRKFSAASLLASGTPAPAIVIANTTTLRGPADVCFDYSGNMFVAADVGGCVARLSAAQLAAGGSGVVPSAVLTMGSAPNGIAFNGDLWVADFVDMTVSRYSGNALSVSGSPVPSVVLSGFSDPPQKLAFDTRGNLWVALFGDSVLRFDAGDLSSSGAKPARVTLTASGALDVPYALRFSP